MGRCLCGKTTCAECAGKDDLTHYLEATERLSARVRALEAAVSRAFEYLRDDDYTAAEAVLATVKLAPPALAAPASEREPVSPVLHDVACPCCGAPAKAASGHTVRCGHCDAQFTYHSNPRWRAEKGES